MSKGIGPREFWSIQKGSYKYVIKPVVYGDVWCHFRKMALRSIRKALGVPLKVDGVLRLCEMSKGIGPEHFGAPRQVDQNTL